MVASGGRRSRVRDRPGTACDETSCGASLGCAVAVQIARIRIYRSYAGSAGNIQCAGTGGTRDDLSAASRADTALPSAALPGRDALPPRSLGDSAFFEDEELAAGGRVAHDLGLIGEHPAPEGVVDHRLELLGEHALIGDANATNELFLTRLDQGLLGGGEHLVHHAADVDVVEDVRLRPRRPASV